MLISNQQPCETSQVITCGITMKIQEIVRQMLFR